MIKRGQTTAGNVATLLSLIALFMIAYILLIPQEERNKLLYGNETVPGQGITTGVGKVLISEFIGKVKEKEGSAIVSHDVANVNLFTTQDQNIITLSDGLIISKGFFGAENKNLFFKLEKPLDVIKTELYIIIENGEGSLVIKINDKEFYNKEISGGQIKVEIPVNYLQEENNLEFSIKGFGSKEYNIREVKLRKQTEIRNRVARRTFSVTPEEKSKMQRAIMKYNVFCNKDEDKSLKVTLNNKVLISDVPFCNLKEDVIEIAPEYLNPGINYLDFETDGDYVIEGVLFKTFAKATQLPDYYFSLTEDEFKDVRRNLLDVMASFEFSLIDDRKAFTLEINGKELNIDTTKDTQFIDISDYIEQENLIRINPKNNFEILEFKVALE